MPQPRSNRSGRVLETPNGSVAVSEQDYRTAVQADKHVYWTPGGEPVKVRVWDTLDQAWAKPLPEDDVHRLYLRKVVFKCSSCSFTSARHGDVSSHLNQTREQGELHSDAVLEPVSGSNGERGYVCTGCDNSFLARQGMAKKHLDRIQEAAASHRGMVAELTVLRFTLSPSEPPLLSRIVLQEGDEVEEVSGPDSAQVVGSVAPSSRKRRRTHRSRSKRGNANANA